MGGKRVVVTQGQRFGAWLVLGEVAPVVLSGRAFRACLCRCDCGQERVVRVRLLHHGSSAGCGCRILSGRVRVGCHRHGYGGKNRTKEYCTWGGVKQRCTNPRYHGFKDYGGRGILMDSSWLNSFERFLADVGPAPTPHHQLDRRDNNRGYEPGSVRWVTCDQNARNKRNSRFMTFRGESKLLIEWCERLKLSAVVVRNRQRLGWSDERALGTPIIAKPRRLARA